MGMFSLTAHVFWLILLLIWIMPAYGQILTGPFAGIRTTDLNNVKLNGACGNGICDDRAAIQRALDDPGRSIVFIPDGTYLCNSTSAVTQPDTFGTCLIITRSNVKLWLSDGAIIKGGSALPVGTNLLRIMGTKNVETTTTNAPTIRSTTNALVLTSATGFTIGDDIAITNGTDANPTDYEVNRICGISGLNITVCHPLENAYPGGTRVLDIAWIRNVSIYGGQWDANNFARTLIHGDYIQNSTIESIRGRGTLNDGRCIAATLYSNKNKWIRNFCEDISDRGIEEYTTTWDELIEGNTVLRAGIHGIAVHGRHIRIMNNLTAGGTTPALGYAGIHTDTAHHVTIIGNQSVQNQNHGYQTAFDSVDIILKGNIASSNVGRGFDYFVCTDCISESNIAYNNGDDSYRFGGAGGAGIRILSNFDKSFQSAGFGFNIQASANTTTIFGWTSNGDTSGTVTDAGTSTKFFNLAGGFQANNGGVQAGNPTGNDKGAGSFNGLTYYLNGVLTLSNALPTISSGFGTSPSVVAGSNAATLRVNVGTGGVATSGVVAMNATATNGWNCFVEDQTTANVNTRQTASTTTTVTFGTTVAWTASDILIAVCHAF